MEGNKTTIRQIIEKNGIMVIDGSMSTALEHLGANLNSKLWTARALAESPELVRQVHLDYFKAGADCGITCSYQATIPGLMANGCTREEAEQLIARSVEIFIEARKLWWEEEGEKTGRTWPLCLAGIGPYGAYLADGSEYRGHYGVSDDVLDGFHRRRMEILQEAGADILLIETQPSLREALLAADIAEELGADYWISFSCMDEKHICEGDPIRKCAEAFAQGHPHLQMIGVNCSKPVYIAGLVKELRAGLQTTGRGKTIPIGVYPNSGEEYDPVTKSWHGVGDAKSFGEYALDYMKAGAEAVGGCCTTVADHVEQVVRARARFLAEGGSRNMIPR
ncbi:MAG: homocysteine S-methyltransferase [Eubacteriales bacterium]|nr:homocysteine S-methyltransferase [Eubacteriales bacterium]